MLTNESIPKREAALSLFSSHTINITSWDESSRMDCVSFASPPPTPLRPSPLLLQGALITRAAASKHPISLAPTMALFRPRRNYMLRTGGGSSGASWFTPNSIRRWKLPDFPSIRSSEHHEPQTELAGDGRILVGSAFAVLFAVMNRVLYKLALVPMKQYPFFLAQVTTFGYVAVYFFILYVRYRADIVTKEMLALPKFPFVAIGFLEALGVASGMSAGAMLPGPAIPVLSQMESPCGPIIIMSNSWICHFSAVPWQ